MNSNNYYNTLHGHKPIIGTENAKTCSDVQADGNGDNVNNNNCNIPALSKQFT